MNFSFTTDLQKELIYSLPKKGFTKVAFFDLDHTLIRPKNGRVFPKDGNDFEYTYENVIDRIDDYIQKKYMICILSNQGGLLHPKNQKKRADMIDKLNQIFPKRLNQDHIAIFLACGYNYYRKAHTGVFSFYEDHYQLKIDKKNSFFCGDALGRSGDFSDTDYYFGYNCGIRVFSPESFFENKMVPYVFENPAHHKLISSFFSKERKEKKMAILREIKKINKQKVIMMIGSPASGKSTFSRFLPAKSYLHCESDVYQGKMEACVKSALEASTNLVIDATNATKTIRKKYIDLAKKANKDLSIIAVYIPYHKEEIAHMAHYRIERSKGTVPPLPEIALRIYQSKYQKPEVSEGFDAIYEYQPFMSFTKSEEKRDFMKYYL